MWTSYVLTDGTETGYGYGWSIGQHGSSEVISHGGGIFGFRTEGYRLPEQELFVSVLSNGASASPDVAAIAAVKAMLEEPYKAVPVDLPESQLQQLAGMYRSDDDSVRSARVTDGRLVIELFPGYKVPTTPVGSNRFAIDGMAFEVVFGGNSGKIEYMEIQRLGFKPQRAMRTDEPLSD